MIAIPIPIKCRVEYNVWERTREKGIFTVNGKKITGYRIWKKKSTVFLKWKIPDQKIELFHTLTYREWTNEDFSPNNISDPDNSVVEGFSDFCDDGKNIINTQNFQGSGNEELESFGSSEEPNVVIVFCNGDPRKIVFERRDDVMNLLVRDENSRISQTFSTEIDFLKYLNIILGGSQDVILSRSRPAW